MISINSKTTNPKQIHRIRSTRNTWSSWRSFFLPICRGRRIRAVLMTFLKNRHWSILKGTIWYLIIKIIQCKTLTPISPCRLEVSLKKNKQTLCLSRSSTQAFRPTITTMTMVMRNKASSQRSLKRMRSNKFARMSSRAMRKNLKRINSTLRIPATSIF